MQLIDLLKDAAKVVIVRSQHLTVTGHEIPTGTDMDCLFFNDEDGCEQSYYVNLEQEIALDDSGNFAFIRKYPSYTGWNKEQVFAIAYKFVPYSG